MRSQRLEKKNAAMKAAQQHNELKRSRGVAAPASGDANYRGVVLPTPASADTKLRPASQTKPAAVRPRASTPISNSAGRGVQLAVTPTVQPMKRQRVASWSAANGCDDTGSIVDACTPAVEEDDLYGWNATHCDYTMAVTSHLQRIAVKSGPSTPAGMAAPRFAYPASTTMSPCALTCHLNTDGLFSWLDTDDFSLDAVLQESQQCSAASRVDADDVFSGLPAIPSSFHRSPSPHGASSVSSGSTLADVECVACVELTTPTPTPCKVSVALKRCPCGCWEEVYASSMQTALLLRRPLDIPHIARPLTDNNDTFGSLAFDCPFTVADILHAVACAEFAEMPLHWSLRPELPDGSPGPAVCDGVPAQTNQAFFIHVREE